jgi:DNA polymerase I-like protein with 3'-5' exonuclease and polymerase domains
MYPGNKTYLEKYKDVKVTDCSCLTGKVIAIDFETFYSKDYSLTKMDYYSYCMDDRFDAYVLSAFDGENIIVCHPMEFDWASLKGKRVVSFNAAFDRSVYEIGLGAPAGEPYIEWTCAMAAASYFGYAGALDQVVWARFHQRISKDVRANAKGKTFDYKTLPDDMIVYVASDARWCWKIWKSLGDAWPHSERVLWNHTVEMGLRGLPIDRDKLDEYLEFALKVEAEYADQIPFEKKLSLKKMKEYCEEMNIPPPETTSKTSEEFDMWLEEYGDRVPWIGELPKYRSIRRVRKLLEVMKERLYWNEEFQFWFMPYSLKYFGATTGRWAGSGGWNVQNMPRKPIGRIVENGKVVREGVDVRHLISPPPGYYLGVCDYGQVELRIQAWLAGAKSLLEEIKSTDDAYEPFAVRMKFFDREGGITLREFDEKWGTEIRNQTKRTVLGSQFGMGANTFAKNNNVPVETAKVLVEAFRKGIPEYPAFWKRLNDIATKGLVGSNKAFSFRLPSGRVLYYRGGFRERDKYGKWQWYVWQGRKKVRCSITLYSNNVTQGTARDLIAQAIPVIEYDKQLPVVLSVHDEIVCLIKKDTAEEDAKTIGEVMCSLPEWGKDLPLEAECQVQTYYHK